MVEQGTHNSLAVSSILTQPTKSHKNKIKKQIKNIMNTDNIFLIAAKKKYRFDSGRGLIGAEDLFDLSLDSLDKVAVALDKKIGEAGSKSFITKRTTSNVELETKLEILKYIIDVKQKEADERKARADNAAKKATLEALLEKRNLEKLENLSEEEILKQMAALNA